MAENANSIRLKSGEYGGKYSHRIPLYNNQLRILWYDNTLPGFNQVLDGRVFVDLAIVHYNHGIWRWEWSHVVEKSFNKGRKHLCAEQSLNNFTMEDAINKGEGRKNRKAS